MLCGAGPFARAVCAADGGESVVILVNAASADSESVAAHYAEVRGVPEANICRVTCTTSEVMSRREFDAKIRKPLRQFLLDRGLATARTLDAPFELKPKYLVSTYGVPAKIREDYSDATPEDVARRRGGENAASVDSELALIALPKYKLAGSLPNPLYKLATPDAGMPLLFTTRLDGPTPEIARGLVDAAVHAEKHGLFGIAYIDARDHKNPEYDMGDDWMLDAAAALERAGFFTRVDRLNATFDPDMPMPDAALYFGWYEPGFCGPMAREGFRFATGAVAYHLHSGSAARIRTVRMGWVGPLLEKGAAATMGAVFEPYLSGTVDLGEFTRLFLSGKTFGESAHRATPELSWMMTFVGDPLYAPFRPDRQEAARHDERNRRWLDVREAVEASGDGPGRALAICSKHGSDPLFVELAARALLRHGRVREAAAMYHTLARIAVDEYSSVRAYGLSGELLAGSDLVGGKLLALNEYAECIQVRPRSPHTLDVYRKALGLARSLGQAQIESALWNELAENFPDEAIGRFAAGELWARGFRDMCEQPHLVVPRTAKPPSIDGRPGDEAWKEAAAIEELPNPVGSANGQASAKIRVCFDQSALYVFAEFPAEPHRDGLFPASSGEEALVLTLSPSRGAERGVTVRVPDTRGGVGSGGVVWRSAPSTDDGGWRVEVRIPFSAIGGEPPAKGAIWAANFVREGSVLKFPFRTVETFRSWAQPDDDPLWYECAGYLVFE